MSLSLSLLADFALTPEDAGLLRSTPEALRGGDAEQNAKALLDVLRGKPGPFRDVSILNAAAALIVAGKAKDLKQGASTGATLIFEVPNKAIALVLDGPGGSRLSLGVSHHTP